MDELELASSPSTPGAQLSGLARHSSAVVRRRVAANPAISLPTATALCPEFPVEFLQNLSLPLWQLEDPSLLTRLPPAAAVALARCALATVALLEQLAVHPSVEVRYAVGSSSLVTADIIERLTGPLPGSYIDFRLSELLASHPLTPVRSLEVLAAQDALCRPLGLNPATPPYMIRALAESPGARRAGAAVSRHLPPGFHGRFCRDTDIQLRASLGANPQTPATVLRRLARDPLSTVRLAVAKNPSTPLVTLLSLRRDKNTQVRRTVEEALSRP